MDRDGKTKQRPDARLTGVRLRFQRVEGRPANRVPQELPGVCRRRGRIERPPDRDRPPLQLRAPVVGQRRHLLFLAGEHENCHPYVANADGTGLRKLADRGGYRGVIAFLDVPDFHSGSSDIPAWSADGAAVYYTAQVGPNVELFRVALDGREERLTRTPEGSLHYHPTPSPDGHTWRSDRGGWRASTPRHATLGPVRASIHRPAARPRRHVAALATDDRGLIASVRLARRTPEGEPERSVPPVSPGRRAVSRRLGPTPGRFHPDIR